MKNGNIRVEQVQDWFNTAQLMIKSEHKQGKSTPLPAAYSASSG